MSCIVPIYNPAPDDPTADTLYVTGNKCNHNFDCLQDGLNDVLDRIDGVDGIDGIRGIAWDETTTYVLGDVCSYDSCLHIAKEENILARPDLEPTKWDTFCQQEQLCDNTDQPPSCDTFISTEDNVVRKWKAIDSNGGSAVVNNQLEIDLEDEGGSGGSGLLPLIHSLQYRCKQVGDFSFDFYWSGVNYFDTNILTSLKLKIEVQNNDLETYPNGRYRFIIEDFYLSGPSACGATIKRQRYSSGSWLTISSNIVNCTPGFTMTISRSVDEWFWFDSDGSVGEYYTSNDEEDVLLIITFESSSSGMAETIFSKVCGLPYSCCS